jgi:hypothetical protein
MTTQADAVETPRPAGVSVIAVSHPSIPAYGLDGEATIRTALSFDPGGAGAAGLGSR